MDNNNQAESSNESVGGQRGSVTSNNDSDSQDEENSSSANMEVELDNFRIEWKKELDTSFHKDNINIYDTNENIEEQKEQQACIWFKKGIEAENNKRFNEAIFYYRRAIQLVPNIETLISQKYGEGIYDSDSEEDEDPENWSFKRIVADWFSSPSLNCIPNEVQKGTHVSALPPEVLKYIFQWVISSNIDMKSLEQLALVCRSFYVCARTPEIWKLACRRVWGKSYHQPNIRYKNWRDMFIFKPRVSFHGVYISKTTYIRYGESSFQDVAYQPCFLIEYFRYLRFFPNGVVLMLTTADEPQPTVGKLRYENMSHPDTLSGNYKILGNKVSAVVKKPVVKTRYQKLDLGEQIFHLELEIRTVKRKLHYQLAWNHYSIHTVHRNGQSSITNFDLNSSAFPSFWFSGVRSFTSHSHFPLV